MNPAWNIALIALAALAGVLLGALVGGVPGALVGVLPPSVVAVWEAWHSHRQARAFEKRLAAVEPDEFEALSRASRYGYGDMRIGW